MKVWRFHISSLPFKTSINFKHLTKKKKKKKKKKKITNPLKLFSIFESVLYFFLSLFSYFLLYIIPMQTQKFYTRKKLMGHEQQPKKKKKKSN